MSIRKILKRVKLSAMRKNTQPNHALIHLTFPAIQSYNAISGGRGTGPTPDSIVYISMPLSKSTLGFCGTTIARV